MTSLNSSSRLPIRSPAEFDKPVTFASGRAKLVMSLLSRGSGAPRRKPPGWWRSLPWRTEGVSADGDQDVYSGCHQLGGHAAKLVGPLVGKAVFQYNGAVFDVAEVGKALYQRREIRALLLGVASVPQHSNSGDSAALLRAHRERPRRRDRRAARRIRAGSCLRQPCRWKAMQQRVCVLHTHAISAAVGFNDSQFLSVRAPADDSASMTDGGSGHAAASDHCPTRAASEANLCDHAIRLRNRHRRYCLRRSCYGYDKASSSNQPDHSYPPFFPVGSFNLAVGGSKQRVCLGTLSFS